MVTFLPAFVVALASPHVRVDLRTHDAAAQLASVLASADSIDWVAENSPTISFGIERGDAALRVTVTVRPTGEVTALELTPLGEAHRKPGTTGVLSWLVGEMKDADAIDHLAIEDDGEIAIATRDGRRYLVIPARGAAGNAGVEARWAAEWDSPETMPSS